MDKEQKSNLTKRHLSPKLKYEVGIIWAAKWLRQQLDGPWGRGGVYDSDSFSCSTSSAGGWAYYVYYTATSSVASAGSSPKIVFQGQAPPGDQYLSDDRAGMSVGPIKELMERARDG